MSIAIDVLEKELYLYDQAFKGWKDSAIKEQADKWTRITKERKEIQAAIDILKNHKQ